MDQSFGAVERLIEVHQLDEIEGKRFRHKRAFVLDGVMVELFLVQRDRRGLFTNFWGHHRHYWPADLPAGIAGLPVASVAALTAYRAPTPRFSELAALRPCRGKPPPELASALRRKQ